MQPNFGQMPMPANQAALNQFNAQLQQDYGQQNFNQQQMGGYQQAQQFLGQSDYQQNNGYSQQQ